MQANAAEILSVGQHGGSPSWTLEDFRYRLAGRDEEEDDPLADGAMSADQQEAILRQIAARFQR